MYREQPIIFSCNDDRLVAILHPAAHEASVGVVVAVGGPQYRVGSHRQFVLMARQFAAAGIPTLRFDYRGMGDAEGETRMFDQVDDDIRTAIDSFTTALPHINNVVLLGLCDAASANLIYSYRDDRVGGLILMNPWVRTDQGEARAYLRHYYLRRFFQKAFWRKVVSREFAVKRSVREFLQIRYKAGGGSKGERTAEAQTSSSFIERMLYGLIKFKRPILFLISERDLTAREFVDLCRDNTRWRREIADKRYEFHRIPNADHTLSCRQGLEYATGRAIEWLNSIVIDRSSRHL